MLTYQPRATIYRNGVEVSSIAYSDFLIIVVETKWDISEGA